MGTRDDYTTDQEALDALFALQRYARDNGVSLEAVISALIRAQMVQHYGSQMTVKDMLEIRE
jgi:hypothetical protein